MQYFSTHTDIPFGSFMFVCLDFLAYILVPYKNKRDHYQCNQRLSSQNNVAVKPPLMETSLQWPLFLTDGLNLNSYFNFFKNSQPFSVTAVTKAHPKLKQ